MHTPTVRKRVRPVLLLSESDQQASSSSSDKTVCDQMVIEPSLQLQPQSEPSLPSTAIVPVPEAVERMQLS